MKRFASLAVIYVLAGLFGVSSLEAQGKSGKTKVDVLHKGHVINVAPAAVPAHLAHGDQLVGPPPPPPVTTYTVSVTVDNGSGTVTYTQSVNAGGSFTFAGVFAYGGVISSATGDAQFVVSGYDVVVSFVNSDASAYCYDNPPPPPPF